MPLTADSDFKLRSVTPTIFLPAALFGIGSGAIAPVIVLAARDLGASIGVASLIVALTGIGQLVGDLPAGAFAGRVGERKAMLASVVLIAAALAGCIAATEVWMLGVSIALLGLASAVWGIARHSYLTEVVPYQSNNNEETPVISLAGPPIAPLFPPGYRNITAASSAQRGPSPWRKPRTAGQC